MPKVNIADRHAHIVAGWRHHKAKALLAVRRQWPVSDAGVAATWHTTRDDPKFEVMRQRAIEARRAARRSPTSRQFA